MPLLVVDASSVVHALGDSGARGAQARAHFEGADLHAPALLPYEVQNVFRRLERAGALGTEGAGLCNRDLTELPVTLWPHSVTCFRAWELRYNLTSYDAAYVAVAEALGCPLLTADTAIASAPGIGCPVIMIGGQTAE